MFIDSNFINLIRQFVIILNTKNNQFQVKSISYKLEWLKEFINY